VGNGDRKQEDQVKDDRRPDVERTTRDIQDALFKLGIECLRASHDPLTADAAREIGSLLTVDVPQLHQLIGTWQTLDRLSGHMHTPPPLGRVLTLGGDRHD